MSMSPSRHLSLSITRHQSNGPSLTRSSRVNRPSWAALAALALLLVATSGFGQTSTQTISAKFAAGLGYQPSLVDVQLTGTAKWTMGSDTDQGSVTLKARSDGKSRIDLQFGDGTRSEISVNDPREPQTLRSSGNGWKQLAVHNGWMDANWFFPAFASLTTANNRNFSLTQTTDNSVRAQFAIIGQRAQMTQVIRVLSTTDFVYDTATYRPIGMRWVTHPDQDWNISVPIKILYSDYRDVNGVKVPFHIERYFNGTLQLDMTITAVVLNPGLPDTDFSPAIN